MATSIPSNQILTAAKDAELKKLLRARLTAERHVDEARAEVVQADAAIDEHIARVYPTQPAKPEDAEDGS